MRLGKAAEIGLLVMVGGCGGATPGDAQTPPISSAAEVESWLAQGTYKAWHCEAASHPSRNPSVHGDNRICSNSLVSSAGVGEYPVNGASVKELYAADGGTVVIGYAVAEHTMKGTTGDTWFWYERVPADSAAPHDDAGVVAFGMGGSGPAHDICVGCHQGAGSDANHSGHDFVYTQIH